MLSCHESCSLSEWFKVEHKPTLWKISQDEAARDEINKMKMRDVEDEPE